MIYLISAVFTVVMVVFAVFRPLAIPVCIIIKLCSMPVIYYLNFSFTKSMEMYFYLNLGISRREYRLMPFAVESVSFVMLMIISGSIGYAIS